MFRAYYRGPAPVHSVGYGAHGVHIFEVVRPSGGGIVAPLVDQLHEPTSDGMPDENASMNCVFASETSGIKALKPGTNVNGDMIHDAVYGQGHKGGSDAGVTAPYLLTTFGVVVATDHNTDRHQLRLGIQASLARGLPVLITMPSAWNSQPNSAGYNPNNPNFPTHCGLAYWDTGSELWIVNPWGGFVHKGSYGYWEARFCYGKTYPMSLSGGASMALPATWKDDGTKMTNPVNDKVVALGNRQFVLAHAWDADNVPLENEHPDPRGGTSQTFKNSGLRWTSSTNVVADNIGEQLLAARAALANPAAPAPAPALTDVQRAALVSATAAGDTLKQAQSDIAAFLSLADTIVQASDSLRAAFNTPTPPVSAPGGKK